MENIEIRLRPANLEDCKNLFQWRNAEETRTFFFDSFPIPWENHHKWLENILIDENRFLLIGEGDGHPVGVLRYDIKDNSAECSVYLVPEMSGKGLGTALLKVGSEWVKKEFPDIKEIKAIIFPQNQSSLRAFTKAGYGEYYYVLKYDLQV
jgi:UDP-2,4-diacetamido-2,4,6-trideoxy-beta-L-altropyranose hydrolase